MSMRNVAEVIAGYRAMLDTLKDTEILTEHQKARAIGGLMQALPPPAISSLVPVMREVMVAHVQAYKDKTVSRAAASEGQGSGVRSEPRVVQRPGQSKPKKKAGKGNGGTA